MKLIQLTAPAAWACALLYGDDSGLEPDEVAEVEAMTSELVQEHGSAFLCVSDNEDSTPQEPAFVGGPDFGGWGLDCYTYSMLV